MQRDLREEGQQHRQDHAGEYLQPHEAKGDHALDCRALLCCHRHTVHDLRGDITCVTQQAVEYAGTDPHHSHSNDVIYAHGNAIGAKAGLPVQMVQYIGKQCHEHIGAGQAADVLDELTHQHDGHIRGERPADRAADGIEDKARQRHILLSELLGQRSYGKDTDAHGNAADDRDHRLRHAVIVSAENIVAEIDQTQILNGRAKCIDQEIGIDDQHVLIRENRTELPCKRYRLFCACIPFFKGNALLGEVVFQQCQRQRQNSSAFTCTGEYL